MTRFTEWTPSDIEQMKIAFLQGKAIKVIARQLGRTPTALNKALTRFGIRQNRKPKINPAYPNWRRYWNEQISSDHSVDDAPSETFLSNRFYLKSNDPRWVPLEKVIGYLEKQGYRVSCHQTSSGDYQIDGRIVKAHQLLLLANKLRMEERKPIFMVSEVTC